MTSGSATRVDETPAVVDDAATRDIPLPPRSLRLGLGERDFDSAVSTAEIPALDDVPPTTGTSQAVESAPEPAGRHRLRAPSSALKARTALCAIAAGAGSVAFAGSSTPDRPAPAPVADASDVALAAANTGVDLGPGITAAESAADLSDFDSQLAQGTRIAKAKAAADAAARRPMVVSPIKLGLYQLTSAFAPRWGTFHGGIDMAAPLGTPIHAATDGVVVAAEAASGYGHWVQVKAPDGTITMYGHMASSGVLVQEGQKVTAGDVIALVGSEGFSTGPHVHFEVWKNGKTKIDPGVWLASKGVRLSALTG